MTDEHFFNAMRLWIEQHGHPIGDGSTTCARIGNFVALLWPPCEILIYRDSVVIAENSTPPVYDDAVCAELVRVMFPA